MMDKIEKIARRIAGVQPVYSHNQRISGKIEFVKDTGPVRRDIRVKDFKWSPECLRNLAKILWASQRAHSYAMSAYRLFSKMPSAEFSPDGLLGGRGYIQNVKDMRSDLAKTVEMLSSFTDTIHDEVNADHWSSAEEEAPSVQPIVEDSQQVKSDPEGFVEQQFEAGTGHDFEEDDNGYDDEDDEESNVFENPDASEMNPYVEGDDEDEEDSWSQIATSISKPASKPGSKLPSDDSEQKHGKTEAEMTMNTTTPDRGSYASAIDKLIRFHEKRTASSNLEQSTLPGPRVEHIGPGEADVEWGSDDPSGAMLGGGVNMSDPLIEDWVADGVSGYENFEPDDDAVARDILSLASRVAGHTNYSWLPGADNNKLMPIYDRGVTPEQTQWMRENSKPDLPVSMLPKKERIRDEYWEALRAE